MPDMTYVFAPALAAGLSALGRRRLPQTNGLLAMPGLTAQVEVIRDRWGVPHIYAANVHDLFFAQGFVHAQDRLWQMELNRRIATGRLSELFGELTLDTDRAARTFGFARLGETDLAAMDAEGRAVVDAYTAGVNAFLSGPGYKRGRPVEFTLLRHHPEPWRPEDTLAFSRLMLWELSHAWYSEVVRARLIAAVGPEHAAEIDIQYPPANPAVLPLGIEEHLLGQNDSLLARGLGSNSWAIAPQRSATGHALLANDMHMPLLAPALWYEIHLVLNDGSFNATGVGLAGVPLVLVGHNARIAWGGTLAFTDCEDLFVERFDVNDPLRYQYKGAWQTAEVLQERIHVKGRAEPHVEHVTTTRHGPVISAMIGYPAEARQAAQEATAIAKEGGNGLESAPYAGNNGGSRSDRAYVERVAVCSMALRPSKAMRGFLQLDRAGNWDEFVEAMRLIDATQLNFSYADVDDNIGYWVTGKVPVRAAGYGDVPAPGWTGEYDWVGEVPFEEMPHLLNPAKGYVVHCNNRIVNDDYPHFLGRAWTSGYRARRLADIIESSGRLSAGDCAAMQMDVTCLPGLEFVSKLAGLHGADPDVQIALAMLRAWNGVLDKESTGGTVYEVARYSLVRDLVDQTLGQELANRYLGESFHPVLYPVHEFYGHETGALLRLLDDPTSWWIQQAGGRDAFVQRGLKTAIAWLREELGPEPQNWQWGRIHSTVFPHALGMQKPLDRVFNRGPIPIGGGTDTPLLSAILPGKPYDNLGAAPSFRQIVDLSDLSNSVSIVPPGQSGQLGSPHYDDLIQPWLAGEYHPQVWTREQVEREAEGKLLLRPPNA